MKVNRHIAACNCQLMPFHWSFGLSFQRVYSLGFLSFASHGSWQCDDGEKSTLTHLEPELFETGLTDTHPERRRAMLIRF